jgi:hypothetical protein
MPGGQLARVLAMTCMKRALKLEKFEVKSWMIVPSSRGSMVFRISLASVNFTPSSEVQICTRAGIRIHE